MPTRGLGLTKRALIVDVNDLEAQLELEAIFSRGRPHDRFRGGVRAFIEKRKPNFTENRWQRWDAIRRSGRRCGRDGQRHRPRRRDVRTSGDANDTSSDALKRAFGAASRRISRDRSRRVVSRRMTAGDTVANNHCCGNLCKRPRTLDALRGSGLVIEAVVEVLPQRDPLALEVVGDDAITRHEYVVTLVHQRCQWLQASRAGDRIHFFNPPTVFPLVKSFLVSPTSEGVTSCRARVDRRVGKTTCAQRTHRALS